jgi:bacterial/archaeal transporter family protein
LSPTWLALAVLSTSISAVVNSLDSHFLNRRMPGLRSYLLIIGAFTTLVGFGILLAFPLPLEAGSKAIGAAVISAFIRVAAVFLLLAAMKGEDIARIIPLNSTAPVFVAVMAAGFLGEKLSLLQWLAILTVVCGAVLISFKKGEAGNHRFHARSFIMVIGSALLFAAGDVTNKYALESISYLNTAGLMLLLTSAVFVAVCWRPEVVRQIRGLRRPAVTVTAVLVNQIAAIGATLLGYWVIAHGQVSLASTVFNSKPLFVFLFTMVIARMAPGFLPGSERDPGSIIRKVIATLLIFGGLVVIVSS